ncbi:MAG: SDR family oxidoreductase [Acidobacteriota bacterium]|nr:SDR family oxidoreductase [Acidobacteriota bacterium]
MVATIFNASLFEGKTALVTGGGTGIGLRTARELAQLGATVVLASRKREKLDKAVETIEGEGGKAFAVVCNIREEESVREAVAAAVEAAGPIDLLINNAGGQFPSPAEAINSRGWHAVIETNLTGTFQMTREVFTACMKKRGGSIVNVIANIWRGFPMMAHTGAARAGVDNLTKSLAVEWGRHGVRVNAVAPGTIASSGLSTYDPKFQQAAQATAAFNQAFRLGTEAECSAAILFLLSPAAAFITGETLKIDGGDSLFAPMVPPAQHGKMPPFGET